MEKKYGTEDSNRYYIGDRRDKNFEEDYEKKCEKEPEKKCEKDYEKKYEKDYEKKCERKCEAEVISSRTLVECDGQNITPLGINGPLVAKIPVVIAERNVQIDVEAKIKLEEPAYEIKRIKKDVFLTQCKLIPRAAFPNQFLRTGKLFIAGFVRKNIEYATVECIGSEVVSGIIKHTTADVPFECITAVEFVTPPIVNVRGVTREIELFSSHSAGCSPCAENILGKSLCEQDFEDSINFTEKFFCELEEIRIFEEDIHKDYCPFDSKHPDIQVFKKIVEKMVIFIRLKVLQEQQVNIPGPRTTASDC